MRLQLSNPLLVFACDDYISLNNEERTTEQLMETIQNTSSRQSQLHKHDRDLALSIHNSSFSDLCYFTLHKEFLNILKTSFTVS